MLFRTPPLKRRAIFILSLRDGISEKPSSEMVSHLTMITPAATKPLDGFNFPDNVSWVPLHSTGCFRVVLWVWLVLSTAKFRRPCHLILDRSFFA
jgi:hypothetical protein